MARTLLGWALPGICFMVGFGFAACSGSNSGNDECTPSLSSSSSTSGMGGNGSGGSTSGTGGTGAQATDPETSTNPDNNFHHPMEPSQPGQEDAFEILKQRAQEGPPDVRTRMHSCSN